MHPFLIDLFIHGHHFRLPAYGVMLALGFSTGYFLALHLTVKIKENPKHVENLFLIIVFSAVVGSRLFHVLFEELPYYLEHPLKVFAVWEGGYTFYGALLTCIFAIFIYTRRTGIQLLQYLDLIAPSTALGLAFGRLGCFLAGCCWGKATNLPWAVTFKHPESFCNLRNVPLHPTQLYESFGCLLLFAYLLWLFGRRKYVGQLCFHWLILYSTLRFFVEFFRGDDYRGYVLGGLLSYSQVLSIVILIFTGLGMYLNAKKRSAN